MDNGTGDDGLGVYLLINIPPPIPPVSFILPIFTIYFVRNL